MQQKSKNTTHAVTPSSGKMATPTARRTTVLAGSALALMLFDANRATAHNAIVHRDMTDRAWHVLLALSRNRLEVGGDVELAELANGATRAIANLGSLPAGLPKPKAVTCADKAVVNLYSSSPNWQAPAEFKLLNLAAVRFPIKTTFITGGDCGIDGDWTPGAFFDTVNEPNTFGQRSFVGVVLGFWAHQPDDEEDDFRLFIRPSNAAGLSRVKKYIETAAGAAAATVYVPLSCLIKCTGDFLGIGGSCKSCLDKAIETSKTAAHDAIGGIDGLVPGLPDIGSADLLSGMGHHVKVLPPGASHPWKLNPGAFDDRPGLLIEDAGPVGIPDTVEKAALILGDACGTSVHYDSSLGPKRYEIKQIFDFHQASVARSKDDWQWLNFAHTPFTPLDNLAAFGWKAFREAPRANLLFLGWSLHAFGDAISPMHVVGGFGWGHRPYEDAFERRYEKYLHVKDAEAAKQQALDIARRAVVWRRLVREWRARHPQRGMDVPIRDMITKLAERTYNRVRGPGMLTWPFNSEQSSAYALGGPSRAASIVFFELYPGADTINEDLFVEGVAAELAFLVSVGEYLP